MNIYRIEQTDRQGYDIYDSAVVAAPDFITASKMHPSGDMWEDIRDCDSDKSWHYSYGSWAEHPDSVTVTLLGVAAEHVEPGVICASFNAG